jgi:polar amino acid transport system permease protein
MLPPGVSPNTLAASIAGGRTRSKQVPGSRALAIVSLIAGIGTTATTWLLLIPLAQEQKQFTAHLAFLAISVGGSLVVTAACWPALRALFLSYRSAQALAAGSVVDARLKAARSRESAWTTLGMMLTAWCLLAVVELLTVNNNAVQQTFFNWTIIQASWLEIAKAIRINLLIAVIAQALVLVFGLVLALARLLPGAGARPLRFLAIGYIDTFRAIPTIIVIYLVGFGLPIAQVPLLKDLPDLAYPILAITLSFSAYTAELYRAAIESVHPSQSAAARSLGLSYAQTMRLVVIPQALRRIVPPLLSGFIGLQKDSALVSVVGVIDAFNQAKIYSSYYFNLSAVTTVSLLFIIITIPQTQFVEYLIRREARNR